MFSCWALTPRSRAAAWRSGESGSAPPAANSGASAALTRATARCSSLATDAAIASWPALSAAAPALAPCWALLGSGGALLGSGGACEAQLGVGECRDETLRADPERPGGCREYRRVRVGVACGEQRGERGTNLCRVAVQVPGHHRDHRVVAGRLGVAALDGGVCVSGGLAAVLAPRPRRRCPRRRPR